MHTLLSSPTAALSQAPVAERPIALPPGRGRGGEMLGFLKEHSRAFDPNEVHTLVAAFEKAWESVQASGAIFDTTATESARAILAKHIIAATMDGERDQARLRDGALLALALSNLRTAPDPLR